ncbi:MAG TPA: Snf7 family protein [Gammaproteobacteria bacterium]|nr:Snf7 family protein [Gammaproteobacteria bacterium]
MALITRLSRLFEADFHAVLDRIEEPELQLRQAVREMQFALDQDRQRSKLLRHETGQLDKALTETTAAIESFDQELDICLGAHKDDLARDLLRRKLSSEKQLQAIRQQAQAVESQRRDLDEAIAEQEQQLGAMKQKLELLASHDSAPGGGACTPPESIRSEEIEIALLREKQRRAKS